MGRELLDQPMPAIVFSVASLAILDANPAALELYGYDLDHLRGFSFLDLFAPDGKTATVARVRAELCQAVHVLGPAAQRAADGRKLVARMVLLPCADAGPDVRIALIQDETREHIQREELEASEERYRELFENANDVIFLHDLKAKILAINRMAEQLTGYSRDEVLGEDFERLIAPESREQIQDTEFVSACPRRKGWPRQPVSEQQVSRICRRWLRLGICRCAP
jgi:PAS domain S-box-containing protein